MGCYASGASDEHTETLAEFGRLLGLCFQIRDDIFDYYPADKVGKPTGNDLREGKVTLPLIHALGHTDYPGCRDAASLLARGSLNDDEIASLIRYAIEAGGIDYAESTLLRLRDKAAETLAQLGPDADTTPLLTLLDYIIARDR